MHRILALVFLSLPLSAAERKPVVMTDEGRKLHAECLLVDGHNDLPWELRDEIRKTGAGFHTIDLTKPKKQFQTDIPRLKAGNVGCQFWSAYVPTSTTKTGIAVRQTLEQIDIIHRMVDRYPDT